MANFDSDAEIEQFIAGLPGGLDEFREQIGNGLIANVRGQRGASYLRRLDARESGDLLRRATEAAERSANTSLKATKAASKAACWTAIAALAALLSLALSLYQVLSGR